MEAGYFLDIADNTGDDFSYEILPVNTENRIPIYRNPLILVRSVVRSRALDSTHVARCVKPQTGFKFYNRSGEELFGTEETNTSSCDLNENKFQKLSLSPSIPLIFTYVDNDINEHDID